MWADGGVGARPDMAGTDVALVGTDGALAGTNGALAVLFPLLLPPLNREEVHPAPDPPPSMSNQVEKALLESGVADEVEDDEDDEKGPAPGESNLDTSFSKDSQEVLAYLDVRHENANSWSEILFPLCVGLPMWEYLDSPVRRTPSLPPAIRRTQIPLEIRRAQTLLSAIRRTKILPLEEFLQKCTWSPDWRPASLSPTGDFMLINDDWASHDLSSHKKWAVFNHEAQELSGDKIELLTLMKPSGPSNSVVHPGMGH